MPFIIKPRRDVIEKHGLNGLDKIKPGDLCYIHYKNMVDRWHADMRWTTAHEIYRHVILSGTQFGATEDAFALELAWQVFFVLHVIPYEQEMRKINGDI